MSYRKQLKVFVWKNWTIFRRNTALFVFGAEILITIILVFIFGPKIETIDYYTPQDPNINKMPFFSSGKSGSNDKILSLRKRNFDDNQTSLDMDEIERTAVLYDDDYEESYKRTQREFEDSYLYNFDYQKEYHKNQVNFESGKIAFILPENNNEFDEDIFIDKVMNHPQIKTNVLISSIKFKDENELMNYIGNEKNIKDNDNYFDADVGIKYNESYLTNDEIEIIKSKNNDILAAVIFDKNTYYKYSIRIKSEKIVLPKAETVEQVGKTNLVISRCVNRFEPHNCLANSGVYQVGFIPLQTAVDSAIITSKLNNTQNQRGTFERYRFNDINVLLESDKFYIKPGKEEKEYAFSGHVILIPFLFIGQIFHLSNRIMEDKENKIKEGLVAVGAHRSLFWLGWELIYFPLSLITIVFTMIFNIGNILHNINFLLFIVQLLLYAHFYLSTHCYSYVFLQKK